ncbi:MAG: long-chain fatty acid--CoA ligase, partial [Calditrichaeota bacterium]
MNEKSIFHLFRQVCEEHRDEIAYRFKRDGTWQTLTWGEHYETCKRISKSLIALGLEKGDKVNILGQTRLEWVQIDFGVQNIGAVTVGIYPSNLANDCAFIINHSEAVLLVAENQEQLNKIFEVRDQLPHLRHIVVIDPVADRPAEVLSWQAFLDAGRDVSDDTFLERTEAVTSDDLASIVYTSGTTGVPKGAMLTHGNFVFSSWSASESLYLEPYFETLLFLPLAHVFARLIVHFCMRKALTINIAESIDKVAENIRETRPHFFASVPRIYE